MIIGRGSRTAGRYVDEQEMKRRCFHIAACLITTTIGVVSPHPNTACSQPVEAIAFRLAVSYFDPAHEKGLTESCEQHEFMIDAVRASWNACPELRHLFRPFAGTFQGDCKPDDLDAVWIGTSMTGNAKPDVPYETVLRIAERIGKGCTWVEEQWSSRRPSDGRVFDRTIAYTRIDGSGTSDQCDNMQAMDRLRKLGVRCIRVTTRHYSRFRHASIHLITDRMVDTEYLARAVQEDSLLAEVFEGQMPRKYTPGLAGEHDWVSVKALQDATAFLQPFVLRFKFGWGDCPSGCIHKHFWDVRVTPSQRGPERRWEFDAEILSEEGDSIPGPMLDRIISRE